MKTEKRARLAVVAEERLVHITKVTYSLDELRKATGLLPDALRRRIHNGTLRARHTGRRYIVTGPAAVEAGLWKQGPVVDYQTVIDADVKYTLKEVAAFLDLSYWAAWRLIQANRIKPVDGPTVLVMVRGAELLAYLGGSDEPMRHPESA